MKRLSNPIDFQSKIEQIRKGSIVKTDLGVNVNKGVIKSKGGKYAVVEKEKKFEEAGVKRKKRNYVLYESKLGTEREKDLRKIEEAPKPKPKPKPVPRQRVEEKIIQKKKRREYLDNYQYHETKYVKNPKTLSVVTHQRLGEIIGGFYEENTYQRMTMNEPGQGRPKLYSEQTTTTTTRRGLLEEDLKDNPQKHLSDLIRFRELFLPKRENIDKKSNNIPTILIKEILRF